MNDQESEKYNPLCVPISLYNLQKITLSIGPQLIKCHQPHNLSCTNSIHFLIEKNWAEVIVGRIRATYQLQKWV